MLRYQYKLLLRNFEDSRLEKIFLPFNKLSRNIIQGKNIIIVETLMWRERFVFKQYVLNKATNTV